MYAAVAAVDTSAVAEVAFRDVIGNDIARDSWRTVDTADAASKTATVARDSIPRDNRRAAITPYTTAFMIVIAVIINLVVDYKRLSVTNAVYGGATVTSKSVLADRGRTVIAAYTAAIIRFVV